MNATTYTATATDGRTFTRNSERTYTHAVIVDFPTHTEVKFAGSLDLARKTADSVVPIPRKASREWVARQTALRAATVVEIVEVVPKPRG